MILKRIEIEKFRHLNNINFEFGKHLTIIAGGNGTGKTSILGLIGHIFKYGTLNKTLLSERYETKFSKVFTFSHIFDRGGDHKYKIIFTDDSYRTAISRVSNENSKERFRIDVGKREKKMGKVIFPVFYLGLKRFFPIALDRESSIKLGSIDELNDTLKGVYNNCYNSIFSLEDSIMPLHTKSSNKLSYAPTTEEYDSLGVSAGQDNIGQIILALLSFLNLKEKLQDDYEGGLILIDELDATLYPAAQKNLLNLLLEFAQNLSLQIIFTTHSSDILNYVASREGSQFKHNTKFISLTNVHGNVEVKQGYHELSALLADLNHQVLINIKPRKINVYFEDAEAKLFYKNLVSDIEFVDENIVLDFKDLSLPCGTYRSLLQKGFEEFTTSIVVLDGDDKKNTITGSGAKNVIYLPGEVRPENVIKDFLNSLDQSDEFWKNGIQYTKRVFLHNINGVSDNRDSMKRWFNSEIGYWGEEGVNLFQRWKTQNPELTSQIINETKIIVSNILTNFHNLLSKKT